MSGIMAEITLTDEEGEALERLCGILRHAPPSTLIRVLEALEGRHTGPVTRMRARTRARTHAMPPPLLAPNPYKTRAAGNADNPGKCGRAGDGYPPAV